MKIQSIEEDKHVNKYKSEWSVGDGDCKNNNNNKRFQRQEVLALDLGFKSSHVPFSQLFKSFKPQSSLL